MAQRVFVGLSGGVDSAVSAALLKSRGYDIVGAFIKIWSPEFLECTWREDRLDAMRVCATLGIPFREVDLSREYRDEVVANMIEHYRKGMTPNPDVLCNRRIKFGAFAQWAFAQGAETIATGHYARIRHTNLTCADTHKSDLCVSCTFSLLRGKDASKDQSYFLYRLEQDDLRRTLFPIGEYEKRDVRALAKEFDLPVAAKPDSQGLCFVGDITLSEFLSRFMPLERGPIIDAHGETIGEHDGAALYTPGQRHGIHATGGPHFVTTIDTHANIVHVSTEVDDALSRETTLESAHWIEREPAFPLIAQAMPRYRAPAAPVRIRQENGVLRATFTQSQLLSPGQSLVVYDGECCLGGGIIANLR